MVTSTAQDFRDVARNDKTNLKSLNFFSLFFHHAHVCAQATFSCGVKTLEKNSIEFLSLRKVISFNSSSEQEALQLGRFC